MDPIISIVGLSLIALGLSWYCYRTGRYDGMNVGYECGWRIGCRDGCDIAMNSIVECDCCHDDSPCHYYQPSEN